MRIRAAVLHEYRTPLEVCELELDPPRRRRGARARGRRASATPTCTWPTATSATVATRSCSATRAPAWSRRSARAWSHVAPGDPVAFCFVPACGTCAACAAGRRNLCEAAAAAAWAGTLLDGTSRLRFPDGRPVKHFNFVSCFAERCVVPAGVGRPGPAALPLWQARCSAAAW